MSEKANLNEDLKTTLTLETGDEKISISIKGVSPDVAEFMDLVELLLINAKYDKEEVNNYVLQWAKDIKSSKGN